MDSRVQGIYRKLWTPMCRCVGWNSYPRVYTSEKLLQLQKQVHDCKHGLMGYNKRFLALTAGAPGSTHDARFLRSTEVFQRYYCRRCYTWQSVKPGWWIWGIALVATGDSAFPCFAWLLKMFNANTQDPKERYYNKNLWSARVVAEHCYSMLKGRFRLIYRRCECKLENAKYIVMACVLFFVLLLEILACLGGSCKLKNWLSLIKGLSQKKANEKAIQLQSKLLIGYGNINR